MCSVRIPSTIHHPILPCSGLIPISSFMLLDVYIIPSLIGSICFLFCAFVSLRNEPWVVPGLVSVIYLEIHHNTNRGTTFSSNESPICGCMYLEIHCEILYQILLFTQEHFLHSFSYILLPHAIVFQ